MRALAGALVLLCLSTAQAEQRYEGEVVPRDFTPVFAPQNTLRLPHWGSSSNGIQLQEVKPEDSRVAAGETIAVFKFAFDRARQYIEDDARSLRSRRDDELQGLSRQIEDLENQVKKQIIEREKLRLDLLIANGLAKIKEKLLEFDFQLKALETQSTERELSTARQQRVWSQRVHEQRIRACETQLDVFAETKARYTVKAPVAGRLFYPTMESSNRKVRQGDDMNSGTHVLSIVQSDRAQVRFFLPEADWSRVREGDTVLVNPDGPAPARAHVCRIDFFAQFVGDARHNFRLPTAWEKCFVALADLDAPFSSIPKKEVTVGLTR